MIRGFADRGDKMPDWVVQGFEHYARRIRGRFALRLIEIAAEKRSRNAPLARLMQAEEEKIKARIPPGPPTAGIRN